MDIKYEMAIHSMKANSVYYTKKIMFIPTKKQSKILYYQFNLAKVWQKRIVDLCFNHIIDLKKRSKDGDVSATNELVHLTLETRSISYRYFDMVKEIYDAERAIILQHEEKIRKDGNSKYKVAAGLKPILFNYQQLFFSISNKINSYMVRFPSIKIKKLPYYSIYKNGESNYPVTFFLPKCFRKTDDYYKDSLHVYIPYLSYVRLKDREGYFTKEDWNNCYKIGIEKDQERRRYYIIFYCKALGDIEDELWSSRVNSKFRREYAIKYRPPIAPSNVRVIDEKTGFQSVKYTRFDRVDLKELAQYIEGIRLYASCYITKDFSVGIVKPELDRTPDIRLSLVNFPKEFQADRYAIFENIIKNPNELSKFTLDMSLYPKIRRNIDRYSKLIEKLTLLEEKFPKDCSEVEKWDSIKYTTLKNRAHKLRYRIICQIRNVINHLVCTMTCTLPKKIYVMIEPYSLSTAKIPKKYLEFTTIAIHQFLRKIKLKAQMLRIALFVMNPDQITLNPRKTCPFCNHPTQLIYQAPIFPKRDFAAIFRCTNPKCKWSGFNGFYRPLTIVGALDLNILFENLTNKVTLHRDQYFEKRYINRWYPTSTPVRKYHPHTKTLQPYLSEYSQYFG